MKLTQFHELSKIRTGSTREKIKTVMVIIITFILIGCSFYIILSKNFSSDTEKLAAGLIGAVSGYWLK